MKTSLEHLPGAKQREVLEIVEIIKNAINPEKVILFGSYATGKWIEDKYFDEHTHYDYVSDYDFLIITKDDSEKEYVLTEKILSRSRDRYRIPVSPIVHSIAYVNEGIERGQYFFTEIIKDGILLFDTDNVSFANPKNFTAEERKLIAEDYFDIWYKKGTNFLRFTQLAFADLKERNEPLNEAAYLLHQATEGLYNCVLLVFNGYKPKTHNLDKLRKYVKPLSYELFEIFPYPVNDLKEEHLFDLLKRAYIEARYKREYTIFEDELSTLIERIYRMRDIVEKICKQRINSFQ